MQLEHIEDTFRKIADHIDKAIDKQGLEALFADVDGLKKASGLRAEDIEQLTYQTDYYCQNHEWEQATKFLFCLILLEPLDYSHYLRLGAVYMQQRKFKEATQIFELSHNLEPYDPRSTFYRGICFMALNDTANAQAAFTQCLSLIGEQPNDETKEMHQVSKKALSQLGA
jgi:tetratricopeptide (TPR) repeat protein